MAVEQQPNQFIERSQGSQTSVKTTNSSQVLSGATNSLRSNTIKDNLNGTTLHLCVDITTAFSSAASTPVTLEGSLDDTNWSSLSGLSASITPNTTGPRFFTVDLTKLNGVPYFSIHFNGGAGISSKSVGTSGKVSFSYYTT